MPEKHKILLHVGYPKTGSTTLQRALFAKHPQVGHLGKPFFDKKVDEYPMILGFENSILRESEDSFSRHCPATVRWLTALIELLGKDSTVLSHEGLLRCTRYGHAEQGVETSGHDLLKTAVRLHRVFDATAAALNAELKVLIVVRKQSDILCSYHGYFHRGENWRRFYKTNIATELNGFAKTLLYDEIVGDYRALFGPTAVHVLPFEALKTGADAFYTKVANIAGIDPGVALELIRGEHHKSGGKSKQHRLSGEEEQCIRKRYALSNKRLADLCGLDLASYGYAVA